MYISGTTDLVITDNRMPILGGLQFLDTLRENFEGQSVPVILHSGNLNESDKQKAFNAGAFAILDKPCSLREIQRVIEQAIYYHGSDNKRGNGAFKKLDGITGRIQQLGEGKSE